MIANLNYSSFKCQFCKCSHCKCGRLRVDNIALIQKITSYYTLIIILNTYQTFTQILDSIIHLCNILKQC